jgi:hypothetical protein
VTTRFNCETSGDCVRYVKGSSTPAQGVYAKVLLKIDGKRIEETELSSSDPGIFSAGRLHLEKGKHELSVEFTNDLWENSEDRSLILIDVGFLLEK